MTPYSMLITFAGSCRGEALSLLAVALASLTQPDKSPTENRCEPVEASVIG